MFLFSLYFGRKLNISLGTNNVSQIGNDCHRALMPLPIQGSPLERGSVRVVFWRRLVVFLRCFKHDAMIDLERDVVSHGCV